MQDRPRGTEELTTEQIEAGVHRQKVGGAWDEIGSLQFEFLKSRGLEPHHNLLDIGCGALRGGVHFIRYLDAGNYYGMDAESSLLEAGKWELQQEGLAEKTPSLLASQNFGVGRFEVQFDYAIAISLFTHLNLNQIAVCLRKMRPTLKGEFYASFFEAPYPAHINPILRESIPHRQSFTYYDRDPYHYAFPEMRFLANRCRFEAELVGDWGHPRDQRMLRFTPKK